MPRDDPRPRSKAIVCQNLACADPSRPARFDRLTKLLLCDECWAEVPARRLDAPQPAAERCGGR